MQLKRHVGVEIMRQLISSFIFSRLDYCNALLIRVSFSIIALLLTQNGPERCHTCMGLSRRDHERPALKELHWLPVVYRIQFKLALVMFTIRKSRCLDYLTDSVQACSSDRLHSRPALTILGVPRRQPHRRSGLAKPALCGSRPPVP